MFPAGPATSSARTTRPPRLRPLNAPPDSVPLQRPGSLSSSVGGRKSGLGVDASPECLENWTYLRDTLAKLFELGLKRVKSVAVEITMRPECAYGKGSEDGRGVSNVRSGAGYG